MLNVYFIPCHRWEAGYHVEVLVETINILEISPCFLEILNDVLAQKATLEIYFN